MSNTEVIQLEAVLSRANMQAAWAAVKRNDGSAGVDRKSIEQTLKHLAVHWPLVRHKLETGTYSPAAVRAVAIPKSQGGTRILGIPTVQDRLIQQALHQVLNASLDSSMSEHSYGFRPKRSAHDAVTTARGYVAAGKSWVVDIDLRNFFDQVNHDRLMSMLSRRIADKRILQLIGRYLRAPMRQADGTQNKRTRGTPQGGPLSPILANLYLDPLDVELAVRGIAFVRYADDIVLFCASERAAKRALENVKAWLKKALDLEINDEKSGTGRSENTQLLGFRIHAQGDVSPSPKAIEKLKTTVRALWSARQSKTSEALRDQWQQYIRGWWNYFRYANDQRDVEGLSGWIRRHMRKCFWQRWHGAKGRYNALRQMGIRGKVLKIASTKLGAWPMSIHPVVNTALRTSVLNRYGFTIPWQLVA